MIQDLLNQELDDLKRRGLKRKLRWIAGPQGREIVCDGKRVLNFCSNDYLGLSHDPRLVQAAICSMREQGLGSGASRLVCGSFSAHRELEETLARFKAVPRCLVFNTGYMANVGIIASLFGRDHVIFCDRLNHASIIDGVILSRAKLRRYPHCDVPALEHMLKNTSSHQKKAIMTDTVFSMDGDVAPLDRLAALAEKYQCDFMVDEAHALGVLGNHGRGAVELFGLEGKNVIQMGTLSKAAGAMGAYCCGTDELIDFLIQRARSFIYSTAMPPGLAAAARRGIEIMASEPHLRERLWKNTKYMHGALESLGFNILNSQTPIIPVIIGQADLAVRFSNELFDRGVLVTAIRPPTVPENTARLRLTLTAEHLQQDLDYVLKQFEQVGKKLCVLSRQQKTTPVKAWRNGLLGGMEPPSHRFPAASGESVSIEGPRT